MSQISINPGDADTGMGGLVGLVDMDKQAGQGFGGRGIGQFPRIDGAATAVLHQLHHFLAGLQVVTGYQDIAVDSPRPAPAGWRLRCDTLQ